MIIKINNKQNKIAKEIKTIFQASYTVEAKLLKVVDFPPLKRKVSKFMTSKSDFYAYYHIKNIAGVIEINNHKDLIHIKSLVVYPKYFRKGIGSKLVQFILNTYNSNKFAVETAVENYPAIRLYENFGFKEQKKWDTNHGIRKIRFEKRQQV